MMLRPWLSLGLLLAGSVHVIPLIAEPFSVSSRTTEVPESGQVTYTIIRTEKNETSFLPPPGWKSEVDAKAGTITWTSPDYQSMIRLKITGSGGDQSPKPRPEELREVVAQEFASAKINEEFPCFTSGASGLALDCEHVVKNQFVMSSRVALVPIPGGLAQFTLTSPKDQFTKRQGDLSRFLNSFRIENGKSH
jgi:hypothetical protein